jgi:hypothetical protein
MHIVCRKTLPAFLAFLVLSGLHRSSVYGQDKRLEMPTSLPKFTILEILGSSRAPIELSIAQRSAITDSPVIQKYRRDIESHVPEGFRNDSTDVWTAAKGIDRDEISRAAKAVIDALSGTEAVDRAVDAVLKDDQRSALTEVQRRLYVPILMTPTDLVLLKYDGVRKEIEIDGAQSQRLDELWSRGNKLAPLPEDLLTAKQQRRLNQVKLQCGLMNPDAWKRARVPGKARVFFERIRPALILKSAAKITGDTSDVLKDLAAFRMAEVPAL